MLKAGVIGLGVGQRHAETYHEHSFCSELSLCDLSEDRLRSVGKEYPDSKLCTDADEILEDDDIGIVSIASYDNFHYEQIVKAIENDKHVFVEKPFCMYESEALRIRSLLQAKPHLRLSSNLILRKYERFAQVKSILDEGQLGDIYYLESDYNYGRLNKITEGWRGQLDFYSVVYGGGVHIVDLLLWLTGEKVLEVSSYGNKICSADSGFSNNDMVVSILKFESGKIGKVSCNFGCVYPHFHKLCIYGTEGTFENDLSEGRLFFSRDPEAEIRKVAGPYSGVSKGSLLKDFIDSIENNSNISPDAEDIFRSMSVCFAIEKSVQSGGSVQVNYI